jgi:adenylyl-sulfate kinase
MSRGVTVWFTGLPCSGKTTVADGVAEALRGQGYRVERLDGDIVRRSLTSDLGFSKEDRDENIKRVTFVAKLLTRNGVIVLATFVSPYRERRRKSREEIGEFMEVYVRCSMEECMRRDVKGMYRKAMAGEITGFTGVDDPYEEPQSPELVLDTDEETVEESVRKVLEKMRSLGYLQ